MLKSSNYFKEKSKEKDTNAFEEKEKFCKETPLNKTINVSFVVNFNKIIISTIINNTINVSFLVNFNKLIITAIINYIDKI